MTQLLWQPTDVEIKKSQMFQFMQSINKKYGLSLNHYQDLHKWSLSEKKLFWQEVSQFCNIHFQQKAKEVLINEEQIMNAKWFRESKLNYAENCLKANPNHIALISIDERQNRKCYSYLALNQQVAAIANSLKAFGIKKGDRVAGLLPNTAETIIAMLATVSIGAIWSCCSPEFGFQGVLDRFGQIETKVLFASDGYLYNGKPYSGIEKLTNLSLKLSSLEKIVVVPFLDSKINISSIKHSILWEEFKSYDTTLSFASLDFDHPLYILYSSGTTGKPKCIVHGTGTTLIQHLKELKLHTDLTEKDTFFYYTTCGWMMWNWMVSSLALGSTLVLYEGNPTYPNFDQLFKLIDKEKITVFGTSARYIASVEKAGLVPKESHQLTSLKTILSTGSPLNPQCFDFVYQNIKKDLILSSISGGTDIVSCFALGCPIKGVYRGEIQCVGLGMDVAVFNEQGQPVKEEKGELVCLSPFPSMPLGFWNDKTGDNYFNAYFSRYPNVWAHGDYAKLTKHQGLIIYGRSDAVLNPGGVRIGTAEIYRQVEKINEIVDSVAIGQSFKGDERIILFVQLKPGFDLDKSLEQKIKTVIKENTSPRHVPAKVLQVADVPRTINGKIVELAVKATIAGKPIQNLEALANPEALEDFKNRPELLS